MAPKALILAIVGTACVGAAAAGGYAALRINAPAVDRPSVVSQGTTQAVSPNVTQKAPAVIPTKTHVPRAPESTAIASPDPTPTPSPDAAVKPEPPQPVVVAADPPAPPLPEPAPPKFEELTIKEDAVIGIRLDSAITSATARVEDKVTARVTRDVTVDGRTALPSGARLEGDVTQVDRGGKFKGASRIVIKFHTLLLADGSRVRMSTEPITRIGEGPGGEAGAKVGAGATIGAILGAVIGGRKGAVIGGAAGAAGGTAAVMAGGANDAVIPEGAPLTLRLVAPLAVIVAR